MAVQSADTNVRSWLIARQGASDLVTIRQQSCAPERQSELRGADSIFNLPMRTPVAHRTL
jgi:hypothetical protein